MSNTAIDLEQSLNNFDKRYRMKKITNMIVCIFIVCMGIFSVEYIWNIDKEGVLTFRWMTVDGTLFTTILTTMVIVVNLYELIRKRELSRHLAYLARLASAVAEGIILIVVLISQLPFFTEHMHIARIDMFFMHLCIPLLTILSFITNESPERKLSIFDITIGTSYVIVYLIIIVTMIQTGILTSEWIPYSFLNFQSYGIIAPIGFFVIAYIGAGVLAYYLSVWNRKMYWLWFRNVTNKKSTG